MLHDLSRSLSSCLADWLPAGTAVRLDPPQESWLAKPPAAPFVDAYLYDIREDARATAADAVLVRDEEGRAHGWQAPIRRYRASFLVSAWPGTGDPAVEYELLDAVLTGAVTCGCMPEQHRLGRLAETPLPVLMCCAPSERAADAVHVWSSLRMPGRIALDLLVVAALVPPLDTELAPGARRIALDVQNGDHAVPAPKRPPQARRWEGSTISE